MKQVRFAQSVAILLEDSVKELVEKNYFSEEDYAVAYIRDVASFFMLNLPYLMSVDAPEYFNRYRVDGKLLKMVKYRKSSRTTWYAFFEELDDIYSIVYVANNHLIGHKLNILL
jgi:hypothetical protein